MIFVTVGTERFSFDRLLVAVDEGVSSGKISSEVNAQTGNSHYVPKLLTHERFLPFDKMVEHIRKADIVVSHAGVGSTLLCLSLKKIPILFPRLKERGEHLDDHQVEFTRQMEKNGKVIAAYDERDLFYNISNYEELVRGIEGQSVAPNVNDSLIDFLKQIAGGDNK
ncbi:MAG: glycosyltransferase [Nitrospirota bacterium]